MVQAQRATKKNQHWQIFWEYELHSGWGGEGQHARHLFAKNELSVFVKSLSSGELLRNS